MLPPTLAWQDNANLQGSGPSRRTFSDFQSLHSLAGRRLLLVVLDEIALVVERKQRPDGSGHRLVELVVGS